MQVTVAIDFDGTITKKSPYPVMGEIRPQIKPFLLRLHEEGFHLVLNTCRRGKYFREALVALKRAGIYDLFDWKYPRSRKNKGKYGKIVAAYYFDDSALPFELEDVDWDSLAESVIQKLRRKCLKI